MRYEPIEKDFYIDNRKKLLDKIEPNSVVVIGSNDILSTNADGTLPFKQNTSFFYLTGIDQEESYLILAPNHPDPTLREILYLRETSKHIAIWEGQKIDKELGVHLTGIKNIKWHNQFEVGLINAMKYSENLYLFKNDHDRLDTPMQAANDRLIAKCKDLFPLHNFKRLAPILDDLRTCKRSQEIKTLKRACKITEKGFREALKVIRPGLKEYELEAVYSYSFLKEGSRGFGYAPIIAGGVKACVLHYLSNDQTLRDGELLLMDVGAEYGNYNADMTRTIPVNGKFTSRQKAVYNAVLRVKNEATKMLIPGTSLDSYNTEVGKLMETELIDLGLLNKVDIKKQNPKEPLYKKYFMHNTSHHLGLDVHDVPNRFRKLENGMVLTVEPGIYIWDEGIGVRLEDDILVADDRPINLMENIPIEADEIEDLMNTGDLI